MNIPRTRIKKIETTSGAYQLNESWRPPVRLPPEGGSHAVLVVARDSCCATRGFRLQPEGYGNTLTGSPCVISVGPLTTTRSPAVTPLTTVMTLPNTCPSSTGLTRATSDAFSRC